MEEIWIKFRDGLSKYKNREYFLPKIKQAIGIIILFCILYLIGNYLPVGYDWKFYFSKGIIPSIWVPWTRIIIESINLPTVFAITIIALGIRTYQIKASPIAFFLTFVSLPTLWVLYLGNLDGIVMLGLLLLPWGAPLVLLKPQVASFAILARWKSLIVGSVWVLISFLIWGLWPLNFLEVLGADWAETWANDISLFPWGLLIALPLMWFSRGDEDLLMAAGSLGTPHLFPYHFIVLMPALGRMKWPWMVLTWLLAWMPLSAEWVGDIGWHAGNLVSLCFWFGIYLNKESRGKRKSDKAIGIEATISS